MARNLTGWDTQYTNLNDVALMKSAGKTVVFRELHRSTASLI